MRNMLLTEECTDAMNRERANFEFLVSIDVLDGTASVEKEYKITVTKCSFAQEVFIKHYRYKCLVDLIHSEYHCGSLNQISGAVSIKYGAQHCRQDQVWSFFCCQKTNQSAFLSDQWWCYWLIWCKYHTQILNVTVLQLLMKWPRLE